MGPIEKILRKAAKIMEADRIYVTGCCSAIKAATRDNFCVTKKFFADLFAPVEPVAEGDTFVMTDGTAPEDEPRGNCAYYMELKSERFDSDATHSRRILALLFAAEVAAQEGV